MEKLIKRFEDIIDQEFIYTLEYPDTHDATLCAEETKKVAIEFAQHLQIYLSTWSEEDINKEFEDFIENYYNKI